MGSTINTPMQIVSIKSLDTDWTVLLTGILQEQVLKVGPEFS